MSACIYLYAKQIQHSNQKTKKKAAAAAQQQTALLGMLHA